MLLATNLLLYLANTAFFLCSFVSFLKPLCAKTAASSPGRSASIAADDVKWIALAVGMFESFFVNLLSWVGFCCIHAFLCTTARDVNYVLTIPD